MCASCRKVRRDGSICANLDLQKTLREMHYLELSDSARKSTARLQNLYSSVRFRSPPPIHSTTYGPSATSTRSHSGNSVGSLCQIETYKRQPATMSRGKSPSFRADLLFEATIQFAYSGASWALIPAHRGHRFRNHRGQ